MLTLSRPTILAAGLGGLLWTVKAIVITAIDGSFDPVESYVFIAGLLAIVAASVLAAVDLNRRKRGARRVALTAATAVGLVAATSLVLVAAAELVAAVASGDNRGLEEEGGILLVGAAWLGVALTAARRPAARGVATA